MTEEEDENRRRIQLIGTFVTIPFVLAVPPIIGWLIGNWLDKKLATTPFLMYVFLILGFAAGIREFYRIIKNYGEKSDEK